MPQLCLDYNLSLLYVYTHNQASVNSLSTASSILSHCHSNMTAATLVLLEAHAVFDCCAKWMLHSPSPLVSHVCASALPPLPCRHNGVYVQTRGLMEQDLMDTMLSYLTRREQDEAPFTVYYAPHAIHQ